MCACACSFYTNKTDTLVQKYSRLLSVYYFGKPQLFQDFLLSLGGSHPKVHGSCSISSLTLKPLPQNCPCSVELILLKLFQRSSAVCFSLLICSLSSLSDIHTAKHRNRLQHQTCLPNTHKGRILHTNIQTRFSSVRSLKSCNIHSALPQSVLFDLMVPPEDGACPKKENGPHALPMKTFFSLPPCLSPSPMPLSFFSHLYTLSLYILLPQITLKRKCIKRKGGRKSVNRFQKTYWYR